MMHLPSMKALQAFAAVMRSGSFTLAAAELHVSAGAIGQQIQKLEAMLGYPLFLRSTRQLWATAAAQTYWQQLQPILQQLQALHQTTPHTDTVRMTLPPSFASRWLAPRLERLARQHPHIRLHLHTSIQPMDLVQEGFDLAIRYFTGEDDGLESQLLCPDEVRVFCSPSYRQQLSLWQVDDLSRATLYATPLQPYWAAWFDRFSSLTPQHVQAIPQIHVDQGVIAIEACSRGQGMLMISPVLVADELASGRLIEPFPCRLPLNHGYHVVHRPQRLSTAARTVKAWLLAEAQQPTG